MIIPQPLTLGAPPIHAVYYAPAAPARSAALLVPPLFDEQRCAHRALQACAVALAVAGVATLHLHLTGTGNSDGSLETVTPDDWQRDLAVAADWLHNAAGGPLTAIGIRCGALLSITAPTDYHLLVQPATSGREYLRQTRTRRLIQDRLTGEVPPTDPHEIEGQRISPALLASLESLVLPDTPPPVTRLLQCSFNTNLLKEYAELLARWALPATTVKALIHEPFWMPHTPHAYRALAAAVAAEVTA